MPVGTSPDIQRVAWSYVVAVLEELDAGHSVLPPGKAQLLASQLQAPGDLLALMDSLIALTVGLWSDAHEGDLHAAYEHARELAMDMAAVPG